MERYELKWKNYQSNVIKSFSNLRTDNDFYDVTLVGDDRALVSAHKLVLASCSEYFKNILKQKQGLNNQLVLCLDGVSFGDLNDMLDFIYNGEVQIRKESLENFLKVANRFKLDGLSETVDFMDSRTAEEEKFLGPHYENLSEIVPDTLAGEDNAETESDTKDFNVQNINRKQRKNAARLARNIEFYSESFESIEAYEETINTLFVKTESNVFRCELCSQEFPIITKMRTHAEVHMKGEHFRCMICFKKKKTRESVRGHIGRDHKDTNEYV